jgi:hypothetical protein
LERKLPENLKLSIAKKIENNLFLKVHTTRAAGFDLMMSLIAVNLLDYCSSVHRGFYGLQLLFV